jgi:Cu-Zn family superoxide dismutase
MEYNPSLFFLNNLLYEIPIAFAEIVGTGNYANIRGIVRFYQVSDGVLVNSEIYNLPTSTGNCSINIFAMHIHEGNSCVSSGEIYNPVNCEHPAHAGDLPPLYASFDGFAWSTFLDTRFKLADVIGRTVMIHYNFDDFMTQPSGNAGIGIACGTIRRS